MLPPETFRRGDCGNRGTPHTRSVPGGPAPEHGGWNLVHRSPEGMGWGGHSPPCKVNRSAMLPPRAAGGVVVLRLSDRAQRPAASRRPWRPRGAAWDRGRQPGRASGRRDCAVCTAWVHCALNSREEEEEGGEREGGRRRGAEEPALRGSAANFPPAAGMASHPPVRNPQERAWQNPPLSDPHLFLLLPGPSS